MTAGPEPSGSECEPAGEEFVVVDIRALSDEGLDDLFGGPTQIFVN